jgi:hypothetical protein
MRDDGGRLRNHNMGQALRHACGKRDVTEVRTPGTAYHATKVSHICYVHHLLANAGQSWEGVE